MTHKTQKPQNQKLTSHSLVNWLLSPLASRLVSSANRRFFTPADNFNVQKLNWAI